MDSVRVRVSLGSIYDKCIFLDTFGLATYVANVLTKELAINVPGATLSWRLRHSLPFFLNTANDKCTRDSLI